MSISRTGNLEEIIGRQAVADQVAAELSGNGVSNGVFTHPDLDAAIQRVGMISQNRDGSIGIPTPAANPDAVSFNGFSIDGPPLEVGPQEYRIGTDPWRTDGEGPVDSVASISVGYEAPQMEGTIPGDQREPEPQIAKVSVTQYDRMKGAKWFDGVRNKTVIILGQGGIGSWLTLLMSRLGSYLHTYDMDSYEVHNMSGQLARVTDIGKPKTTAIAEIVRLFNNSPNIVTNGEYTQDSYSGKIVMCAFDNMAARKLAFDKWIATLVANIGNFGPSVAKTHFFQDGRLLAEQLQIFNIPGDRPDLIEKYREERLFDDKEVEDVDCTFKQTSHCAAMIASHMVGFYTNWVTNREENDPKATMLPFFFEHVIPFNMTMQDYANT